MSQNGNKLLLFFDDETAQKNCLLMLLRLNESKPEHARVFAERLGADLSPAWDDDWFNHEIQAKPEYIRIDYDASPRYHIPLRELQQLFGCGLKCAALEIFFDQVGEYAQYHFVENRLVERDELFEKYPEIETCTETHFDCANEDLDDNGVERPVSIKKLIKEEKEQQKFAEDMVGLIRTSIKSGEDPFELMKGALALRAIIKGVVIAIGFGIVTVLLFKGLWLWITVSILLVVALPIYFLSELSEDLGEDDELVEGEA